MNYIKSHMWAILKRYALKYLILADLLIQWKYCKSCDEIKLISDFSKNKSMSSGYNYSCKSCSNLNWIKKYKNKSKQDWLPNISFVYSSIRKISKTNKNKSYEKQ